MQMYKKIIGKIKLQDGIITLFLLCTFFLSSCYKKDPTLLEVSVQFSNGELVKNAKVKLIVEPGGSIRDDEVINACNEFGIAMVFTGRRHFRH